MARHGRDRGWELPDQQCDYPGRAPLDDDVAHRRREVTFLVLAAAFLTSCSFLVSAGTSLAIDLSFDVDALGVTVPAVVPLGAFLFPLSFLAIQLVTELHGRRRAAALLWIGLAFLAMPVLPGWFASLGADPADPLARAGGQGVSLLGCCVVAHVLGGQVYRELRRALRGQRVWVPAAVASLVGQLLGWAAFALLLGLSSGRLSAESSPDDVVAMIVSDGLAGASYAAVASVALALLLQALAGPLARLLRVPRLRERRVAPRARSVSAVDPVFVRRDSTVEITDDDSMVVSTATPPPIPPRRSRPFSTDEETFFERGEQLETGEHEAELEAIPARE
ncbi:MAG TPA: VUT family protein [Kofleriaceae bacterium]|nr:VUT family protein [Kofleriaceae bacterium]